MFINYLYLFLGYYKKATWTDKNPAEEEEHQRARQLEKKRAIIRSGWINANVECDDQGYFLFIGGIGIKLYPSNTDLELRGVNKIGWDGPVTAIISNGNITLVPEMDVLAMSGGCSNSSTLDDSYHSVETPIETLTMRKILIELTTTKN